MKFNSKPKVKQLNRLVSFAVLSIGAISIITPQVNQYVFTLSKNSTIYKAIKQIDNLLFSKAEAGFTPDVGGGIGIPTVQDEIVYNGTQTIHIGGQAIGTTVSTDGEQEIEQGGIASNTTVINGGWQYISDGGISRNTIVNNDGWQAMEDGAQAIDTVINANGTQSIIGGIATNTIVNANGIQAVYSTLGKAINTTVNTGGLQYLGKGGSSLGAILNNGAIQYIDIGGTSISTTVNNGGWQRLFVNGTATDTTINPGGISTAYTGGKFSGQTINNGLLQLGEYDQTSGLNISGSSGMVDIINPTQATYNRNVVINTLSGSQTFIISADLANNAADRITIADTAVGTHYIKVGKEATNGNDYQNISSGKKAQVVSTSGVSAVFKGALSDLDGVELMPNIVQESTNWYLTGYSKQGASKLAKAAFSVGNISYAVLLNSNEEFLRQRMGYIQDNLKNAGIWSKISAGEKTINHDSMKQQTLQVGYDKVIQTAGSKRLTGVMVEHLNASTGYQDSSGKARNTQLGAYHIWQSDSGHYYDLLIKAGKMHNEFSEYTAQQLTGSYNSWNTTISAEYGYQKQLDKGYYLTPMLKLSFGRINSAEYTTPTNTNIKQDGINSLTAKLGVSIGRKVHNANWYINTSLMREFVANNKVTTGAGELQSTLTENLKGTSVELAVGGNLQLNKAGTLYIDAGKSFGGKVTNKWKLQFGYRYNF